MGIGHLGTASKPKKWHEYCLFFVKGLSVLNVIDVGAKMYRLCAPFVVYWFGLVKTVPERSYSTGS
jgi:hypothetical protein